ncbi:MAG: AAA family ATPase [Deltaproteobacteria bacterium]|nr:AAA family ATPase [Deltaproteobacteria bacterium]
MSSRKRRKQSDTPRYKVPSDARRVIEYWRASLQQAESGDPIERDKTGSAREITKQELERGVCSPGVFVDLERAIAAEAKARNGGPSRFDAGKEGRLPVLICPLVLRKKERTVPGPSRVGALWVPAQIERDGRLVPPERDVPWIPRGLLEPVVGEDSIVLGTWKDLEKFSRKYPAREWKGWADYWGYAEQLLRYVTGDGHEALDIEDYRREINATLMLGSTMGSANQALETIYDDVLRGRRPLGALKAFATLADPNPTPFSPTVSFFPSAERMHTGHFSPHYLLAPSQSLALQRVFQIGDGDSLPVTGMPGTGKTTLIQAIVASLFVNSVGQKHPPMIVCSGATNQSVTNIIDSFGRSEPDTGTLGGRWIPDIKSYGTFCVSAARAAESAHYQLERRDGTGFSSELSSFAFLEGAEKEFLRRCEAHFKKSSSLKAAIGLIERAFVTKKQELNKEIFRAHGGAFHWIRAWFDRKVPLVEEELKTLATFDPTLRYELFMLATHYWEARWILAMRDYMASRSGRRPGDEFEGEPRDWHRRAMITPAFVATLSMLPRFFRYERDDPKPPIDWLIVDEASQVTPESGAAVWVVAKRVIVIGDPLQLEPVWNIPPHVDRANAEQLKIVRAEDDRAWEKAERRGLLSSSGSLMRLALRSSRFIEGNSLGVFLSEHRRSIPKIVDFANQLAYRGRLVPIRPDPAVRHLPAFGYVHVPGVSSRSGKSRINLQEADEILAWLLEHEQRLLEAFEAKSLEEVVAIVTPFAAQARELRKAFPRRLNRLTIGTVQALQGAERPIVIFSPVYDRNSTSFMYFDQNVNFLNVAVTRARDSFLVFGDMEIFKPEGTLPSSTLARYLFESNENEIPRSTTAPEREVPGAESERLVTLAQHREILRDAFRSARSELMIVSPTISAGAINADRIEDLIRIALDRGVKVTIYTDNLLDCPNGEMKPASKEGRERIINAGATLHVVRRVHNKSLAIDDHTLVEGSFNWLSAVRREGSDHQKLERSSVYRGATVAGEIEFLRHEMESRRLTIDAPAPGVALNESGTEAEA